MAVKIKVNYKMTRKRVYHFNCLGCGHKRETVNKKRLRVGLCRNCRFNEVNKNQLSLIEQI